MVFHERQKDPLQNVNFSIFDNNAHLNYKDIKTIYACTCMFQLDSNMTKVQFKVVSNKM